MLNRKDLLIYIFISEKREGWKQYFGYWLGKTESTGLNYDSTLPFINIITYHSFECPIENYTPFSMSKKKVGFHIVYNISSADIITCKSEMNNEDESGYSEYMDKISIETSGNDLKNLIFTNIDKTQNRRYDYNRLTCQKNTYALMDSKKDGMKSKISLDFGKYDYFDWKIVITNHIARFSTSCNPGGGGYSTKVEVLTKNETEKATFYKVMKEKERKKGEFFIKYNVDDLINLIKKVEVIGTDEEPYDPEYDNQLNFKFGGKK